MYIFTLHAQVIEEAYKLHCTYASQEYLVAIAKTYTGEHKAALHTSLVAYTTIWCSQELIRL